MDRRFLAERRAQAGSLQVQVAGSAAGEGLRVWTDQVQFGSAAEEGPCARSVPVEAGPATETEARIGSVPAQTEERARAGFVQAQVGSAAEEGPGAGSVQIPVDSPLWGRREHGCSPTFGDQYKFGCRIERIPHSNTYPFPSWG